MVYDPRVRSATSRYCLLIVAAAVVGSGYPGGAALANGRFPEAQRVFEYPGNPNRLYLSATFGLLVTEDRGKNWYTICEEAFALKFLEGDPLLEIMPDGSLLGGIHDTLNRSTDCGCTWQTTLAAAATDVVVDITIDRSTGAVIALMADSSTFPAKYSVSESTDQGKTWSKRSDLPTALAVPVTIDVAPSDSSRIYVSGAPRIEPGTTPNSLLAISSDHAATWQTREINLASASATPFIAAVDPTDPDKLYVRTDEWDDSMYFAANDALLYSDDAGMTWRELARHSAKLFGFALSPDNKTILIGYGDPLQAGGRSTNPDDFGIYKAAVPTFNFDKIFVAAINGLRWNSTGLYVAITENNPDVPTPGMSLGFAATADFTLATSKPLNSLLAVKEVRGPLACNVGLCGDNWKDGVQGVAPLCDLLAASCDVDASAHSLSCDAPADAGTGSGGAGGSGSGGGSSGGVGASGAAGANGMDAGTGGSGGKSGCACSAGPDAGRGGLGLLVIALTATLVRHRRSCQVGPPVRQGSNGGAR